MTEEQNASPGDTHEEQSLPEVPTGLGPEFDVAPSEAGSAENAIGNASADGEVGHAISAEDLSTPAGDEQVEE